MESRLFIVGPTDDLRTTKKYKFLRIESTVAESILQLSLVIIAT